MFETVQQGSSW